MRILSKDTIHSKGRKGLIEPSIVSELGLKDSARPSPDNQGDLLALLQDSTVSSIITQQVAKLTEGDIRFRGKQSRINSLNKLMKKFKEKRIRKQTFSNLLIYQNAFWELGYGEDNKIDGLWVAETREMEILDNKHGKVLGYMQVNDKGSVSFTPEQIIHLKVLDITSDTWGYAYNKNLIRIVNHKIWVQNFLHWLVKTNQFRNIFTFKDAGAKVEDFLSYLRSAENFPTKHLVLESEDFANTILRDFKDGDSFINLINYYNSEIYRILQSPPIVSGTVDNSNRSNSEAQLNSTYFSWMNYLRNEVYMDYFNNDLLPMLGYEDIEAYLPPVDRKVTKDEIEVTAQLKEMGLNKKGVQLMLENAGVEFPEGVELEEKDEQVEGIAFGKPNLFGKPPSRQPQDNFDDRKNGSQSSTREEQLHKKSQPIDYTKYPYVYEVMESE